MKIFRASKYLRHFWTISGRKLMEPVLQKRLNFTNNLDAQITAARQSNAKIWLQNIWILMFGTAILFMLLTNSISSEEISAHCIQWFGKYQGEKLCLPRICRKCKKSKNITYAKITTIALISMFLLDHKYD